MTTATKTKSKATTKAPATRRKPKANMGTLLKASVETAKAIEESKPKAYDVNVKQGSCVTTLSSEWMTRPADQRYLSYDALRAFILRRHSQTQEATRQLRDIQFDAERMVFSLPMGDQRTDLQITNYSAEQIATAADIHRSQLPKLSPHVAAAVIEDRLKQAENQAVKVLSYHPKNDIATLAAITSVDYGRIWDKDIIDVLDYLFAIDPDWKVPGQMDWTTMQMNPGIDPTTQSTTLYASDRDIFVFFCKDHMPVETGKTVNGKPDVHFPGFWMRNSEVGKGSAEMATMWLRGVCMNRCLWGVEGFESVTCKHTKNGPRRFEEKTAASIKRMKQIDPNPFVKLIAAAKAKTIAHDKTEAMNVLSKLQFSGKQAREVIQLSIDEEETEPRSAYDFTQAITAYARQVPHTDKRRMIELKANEVLASAA